MAMVRIPFGQYAPDLPPFGNQGVAALKNVIPHAGGYRPLSSLQTYSSALDDRCQGAFFTKDDSGNVNGFAGDASKLYRLTSASSTWVDESKGGGYNTDSEEAWSFAKFGDQIIATNLADAVQEWTLGSSTDFADLGGSPPQSRYVTAVRPGFVFLSSTAANPARIQWSAINNSTSWPTPGTSAARIVQSGRTDLPGDGGQIVGAVAGLAAADVAIIQERAVWRAIYTGPPTVFSFDQVEGARGSPAPGSLVQVGGILYYLGEDGFYAFDGQGSRSIGGSRVDRTFFETVDPTKYHLVSATADPANKLLLWSYPDTTAGDISNRMLIYNWEIDEWSPGEIDVEFLIKGFSFGIDMDTDLNASETLLDDEDWPSLDSSFWLGGRPILAGFDSSNQLSFFSGEPLDAELETGESSVNDDITLIHRTRPLVEASGLAPTITVQIASRYRLVDMPVYRQAYSVTGGGHTYARSRGRYHRAKAAITGTWEFAQGVEVDGQIVGDAQ